jgi:hypothetical protein
MLIITERQKYKTSQIINYNLQHVNKLWSTQFQCRYFYLYKINDLSLTEVSRFQNELISGITGGLAPHKTTKWSPMGPKAGSNYATVTYYHTHTHTHTY